LPLLIPELPADQGVVCWRARFTDSHSSLGLVLSGMSGHTRDITPLLGISSARYLNLQILHNQQQTDKANLSIYIGATISPRKPSGRNRSRAANTGPEKTPLLRCLREKKAPKRTTNKQSNRLQLSRDFHTQRLVLASSRTLGFFLASRDAAPSMGFYSLTRGSLACLGYF
jgi:hypothetical protein